MNCDMKFFNMKFGDWKFGDMKFGNLKLADITKLNRNYTKSEINFIRNAGAP